MNSILVCQKSPSQHFLKNKKLSFPSTEYSVARIKMSKILEVSCLLKPVQLDLEDAITLSHLLMPCMKGYQLPLTLSCPRSTATVKCTNAFRLFQQLAKSVSFSTYLPAGKTDRSKSIQG